MSVHLTESFEKEMREQLARAALVQSLEDEKARLEKQVEMKEVAIKEAKEGKFAAHLGQTRGSSSTNLQEDKEDEQEGCTQDSNDLAEYSFNQMVKISSEVTANKLGEQKEQLKIKSDVSALQGQSRGVKDGIIMAELRADLGLPYDMDEKALFQCYEAFASETITKAKWRALRNWESKVEELWSIGKALQLKPMGATRYLDGKKGCLKS